MLWVFVWIWRATRGGRSLPGLAVALGLTTFTYGAIIGVLIEAFAPPYGPTAQAVVDAAFAVEG